jgi:2-methylisocitrate lyase-like PEP mutase family enzyme
VPLDFVMENLARIVRSTDLPVTVDLESGYGGTPAEVGRTLERSIEAGAVGCNLEDSEPATGSLRSIAEQVERIAHARKVADAKEVPYFINLRSDVFFSRGKSPASDEERVAMVLERATAYSAAGADGLFVPGLLDKAGIRRVVEGSPLPVNIMVNDEAPSLRELASLGVARVSHGPGPYVLMMKTLAEAARQAAS